MRKRINPGQGRRSARIERVGVVALCLDAVSNHAPLDGAFLR